MTIARSRLIDPSTTRWYHCTSRCVRRAFLLSEGKSNRKEWIENRIKELAEIFAVGIGGFSVISREGMFVGFSLGSYLLLVDYTGRLFREGKTTMSADLAGIFERLGSQCQELATPAGEAPHGSTVRPILRRQPGYVGGSGPTPGRATRGQPGRMSGPMTPSES